MLGVYLLIGWMYVIEVADEKIQKIKSWFK